MGFNSGFKGLITTGLGVVQFLYLLYNRDVIGKASQWTGEQLLTCIDTPCFVNNPMEAFEKKNWFPVITNSDLRYFEVKFLPSRKLHSPNDNFIW
jgi:hypothetical protein